ncbi:hypothetical protein JCM10212_001046 [Sporobolomyces blumeae]
MATSPTTAHAVPHNVQENLFAGVSYFVHDSLHPATKLALEVLLDRWGATPCPPPPPPPRDGPSDQVLPRPPRFDPTKLTHLVTNTLDFPEYTLIAPQSSRHGSDQKGKGKAKSNGSVTAGEKDPDGPKIVSPAWVTRSFDLQALQQSRFYSPNPALTFSGTCICTSELPETDNIAMCAGVEALGGQWRRELTREVTHLICVAERGAKYEMAIKFGAELGIAVVLPQWFEESLKLNQLVPLDIYRFPSPPFATSLRDGSSSKPFAERLVEYWRVKLSASAGSSSSSSSSTIASPPNPTPTTATYVILGLEEGHAKPTNGKMRESEMYFKSASCDGLPASLANRSGSLSLDGRPAQAGTAGSDGSGSTTLAPDHPARPTATASKIFSGKRIYLASDLGVSSGLERALKSKIEQGGGSCWSFGLDGERELAEQESERERSGKRRDDKDSWARRRVAERALRKSDYVVMRTREGWEYWLAYELNISIGTLPWLYHSFLSSTLSSPLARLLHYPLPSRDGVPGFHGKVITVSNYAGPARDYVRSLIEVLGAKFEGTMAKNTDFVVSASDHGSKAIHARTWSIPLVTHLWLEACVVAWSFLSPALSPSYTLAPHANEGTLFTTILGERGWTREAIKAWNDAEDRRDERERASRGVEELEREERLVEEEKEATTVGDRGGGVEEVEAVVDRPIAVPAPKAVKPKPKRAEVDATERERSKDTVTTSKSDKENAIKANKENGSTVRGDPALKKVSKKKHARDDPPAEKDLDTFDDPPAAASTKPASESSARPEAAPTKAVKAISAVVEAPEPARQSKSKPKPTKATPRSRTPSDEHRDKPDVDDGKGKDDESSGLTEDEDGSESDSSSRSGRTPPGSAKAISRHFGLIDAHNLVQPGSKRAAAGKAQAALAAAIIDKNKYDQEQKGSAKKSAGLRRRSSQGRESGSPIKRRKVKTEEGGEVSAEDDEEESKPIVNKKSKPVKRATFDDDADEDKDEMVPKKKVKVANKNLAKATTQDATTQEGAVSSFDNPPKAKPPPIKSNKLKIISTGLGLDKTSSEIKAMKPLGAVWTDQPQAATHLVVKGLSRTEKFLCCLPYCPLIVTKRWIDACIEAGELVDETPYLVKDKKKEAELNDTLEDILARAKKGKILADRNVYITRNVVPELAVMQRIVSACGGIIRPNDLVKNHKKIVSDRNALVVSSPADRREWEKLASEGTPIYSVEAVFVAAMHQDVARGFTNANRVDPQLSA